MNLLYAFLLILIVYPLIGTMLFAIIETIRIPLKLKILIITLGHPLLTILALWIGCSYFNPTVGEYSILFVCGTSLRIPFSTIKYFADFSEDSETVSIEYYSELMQRKIINLKSTEIEKISQSDGRRLIDKPSHLSVRLANQTLTFKILDKIALNVDKK